MSLPEGIAVRCARMVAASPFAPSPLVGALTSYTELPPHPNTYLHLLGELSAVPHPSIPFPAFAHTLPKLSNPRRIPRRATRTLPRTTGRGMELVGERPVCSVATSGCPKRSEDGFPAGARNIPPRPVQPKPHPKPLAQPPHPTQNKKPQTNKVRGFWSG